MGYRELLKLYDKKALSEQEMEQVSKDIEKQDAISEYLFERDGVSLSEEEPAAEGKTGIARGSGTRVSDMDAALQADALRFTRRVNRLIRRAFIKMGIVVGGIVLAILLFVLFALPEIVSLFYYDPGKMVAENTSQFALDLRVYTELAMPGYVRDNVRIEKNGYGNYNIAIYQWFSLNGKTTNVAGTIRKGKMQLYDVNLLQRPFGNVFAWYQMPGGSNDSIRELIADGAKVQSVAGGREWATESLERLGDTEKYQVYITLDRMMPYEDFMDFVEKSGYPINWCAVCTENGIDEKPEYFWARNLGFICAPNSSCMLDWDRETYPNLISWADNANTKEWEEWDDLQKNLKNESYMRQHFVSMLRYMAEQKDFLAMMEMNGSVAEADKEWHSQQYLQAADYVEANGLVVYGCVAVADKETILQMNEDEAVYEIYAEELR